MVAELVDVPRPCTPQGQPELHEHEPDVGFDVGVPRPFDPEAERTEFVVGLVTQGEAPAAVTEFLDHGPAGGAEAAHADFMMSAVKFCTRCSSEAPRIAMVAGGLRCGGAVRMSIEHPRSSQM